MLKGRIIKLVLALAGAIIVGWSAVGQGARDVEVVKLPIEVRRAEGFDPSQSKGLFVGIQRFEDDKFIEVPYAVDDAVDLAYLFALDLELLPPTGVVLALSGEPVKAVSRGHLAALVEKGAVQESAEKSDVLRLLDRQRRSSGAEGLFVATFATHGFSNQGSDFLVAADSLGSFIESTGVLLNEVFDVVGRAGAPRRLVLLDACRERLSAGRRGAGGSAMTQSFRDAIADAEGQVVISGTTLGGFSYDDKQRKNGVFTAALLDGLRGQAPVDGRSFITVRTLADYVNERVLAWIRDYRPEDSSLSGGISWRLEGAVAEMPLAVDISRLRAASDYQKRRGSALARLRQNLEEPLSGAIYDEMKLLLGSDTPSAKRLELLAEIEALDGSVRMRRSLESYWRSTSRSSPSVGDVSSSTGGRRTAIATASREPYRDSVLGIDFVAIEPGSFQMGSPASEEGRLPEREALHQVTLTRGFWMATTEVTQGQWQTLMGDNPSRHHACGLECPVEMVSWNEAIAFANALSWRAGLEECYEETRFKGLDCKGYRLPTEAEWEYAARAKTGARYAGTDDPKAVCQYGNVDSSFGCDDGYADLAPVASFEANGFGLYDMTGNVWEWVGDRYAPYEEDAQDPLGPESGRGRVIRGGSFDYTPRFVRVAYRGGGGPPGRGTDLGFRVARSFP